MFLLCEVVDLRRVVVVVYPTLTAVSLNVGKLVDGKRVFLVKGSAVELLGGRSGLLGGLVLDKGETTTVNAALNLGSPGVPFGLLCLVIQGHVNGIFFRFAGRVQLLQEEFHQLLLAVFRDDWQTINNDERTQPLFHPHVILLS